MVTTAIFYSLIDVATTRVFLPISVHSSCILRPFRYFFFFFLMIRQPPRSTLFPSPPLSRSQGVGEVVPLREPVGGPPDHVLGRAAGIVKQFPHEPQDKLPRYLARGPDRQVDLRFEPRCAA